MFQPHTKFEVCMIPATTVYKAAQNVEIVVVWRN